MSITQNQDALSKADFELFLQLEYGFNMIEMFNENEPYFEALSVALFNARDVTSVVRDMLFGWLSGYALNAFAQGKWDWQAVGEYLMGSCFGHGCALEIMATTGVLGMNIVIFQFNGYNIHFPADLHYGQTIHMARHLDGHIDLLVKPVEYFEKMQMTFGNEQDISEMEVD